VGDGGSRGRSRAARQRARAAMLYRLLGGTRCTASLASRHASRGAEARLAEGWGRWGAGALGEKSALQGAAWGAASQPAPPPPLDPPPHPTPAAGRAWSCRSWQRWWSPTLGSWLCSTRASRTACARCTARRTRSARASCCTVRVCVCVWGGGGAATLLLCLQLAKQQAGCMCALLAARAS
jgi:hypothetical protein